MTASVEAEAEAHQTRFFFILPLRGDIKLQAAEFGPVIMPLSPPKTAAGVTFDINQTSDLPANLQLWQTELKQVSSRKELLKRVQDAPPLLRSRLKDQGYCDAYLAAYVEWVCQITKTKAPNWVTQPHRVADTPITDDTIDLSLTPQAFRQRNIFTIPLNVIQLRRGRPTKSDAHKLKNNAERQHRYRQRVREKLERHEQLESELGQSLRAPHSPSNCLTFTRFNSP
jgi:hypothetical protein